MRRDGNRNNPEIQRLSALEDAAKTAQKGKWGENLQVFKKLTLSNIFILIYIFLGTYQGN